MAALRHDSLQHGVPARALAVLARVAPRDPCPPALLQERGDGQIGTLAQLFGQLVETLAEGDLHDGAQAHERVVAMAPRVLLKVLPAWKCWLEWHI